jgi:hypothetical protein
MSVASDPQTSDYRAHLGSDARQQVRRAAKIEAAGFSTEAATAAAAVVLAILGLSGIYPQYMMPIATIAIAAALLLKGVAIALEFEQLRMETGPIDAATAELGTGMSTELAAGAAGIALGVLALIGLVPGTLVTCALIVFGGALLVGGGETYRVAQLHAPRQPDEADTASRQVAKSAGGVETLVGIGAVVLGILALTGIQPAVLVLVGLLTVASAQLASGLAVSGRMAALLR